MGHPGTGNGIDYFLGIFFCSVPAYTEEKLEEVKTLDERTYLPHGWKFYTGDDPAFAEAMEVLAQDQVLVGGWYAQRVDEAQEAGEVVNHTDLLPGKYTHRGHEGGQEEDRISWTRSTNELGPS